jgi:hypothetical protein
MLLRVICMGLLSGSAPPRGRLEHLLAVAGVGGVEVDDWADDLVDAVQQRRVDRDAGGGKLAVEGASLINDGTALVAYRTVRAAAVGGSGVIAAVTVGLIVGHRASEHSTSPRLRSFAFWMPRLPAQHPAVRARRPSASRHRRKPGPLRRRAIGLGVLAGAVVIGTRLVWSHTMPR